MSMCETSQLNTSKQLTTPTVCFKIGFAQSYFNQTLTMMWTKSSYPACTGPFLYSVRIKSDLYKSCLHFLFWWRLSGRYQDLALQDFGGLKYFVEMPLCMSRSNWNEWGNWGFYLLTVLKSTGLNSGIKKLIQCILPLRHKVFIDVIHKKIHLSA